MPQWIIRGISGQRREKPQRGQDFGQLAQHKPNTNYTHLKQQSQERTTRRNRIRTWVSTVRVQLDQLSYLGGMTFDRDRSRDLDNFKKKPKG
jgi:hypothetical protein